MQSYISWCKGKVHSVGVLKYVIRATCDRTLRNVMLYLQGAMSCIDDLWGEHFPVKTNFVPRYL